MSSSALSAPEGQPLETPARFTLLRPGAESVADARHDETLLEQASTLGRPLASVWQTGRSLVVPRSYRRFPAFDAACRQFAQDGWPVTVRQTGGGIVPQGPGILNLSLAYPVQGPPMRHSEAGYLLICRILADALQALDIDAFPAAVKGSFCDGRYNLAVRLHGAAVKIAGTAQAWRKQAGSADTYIGLVHALVLLDIDSSAVTAAANAFETAIGSERRYQADKVVSVSELLGVSAGVQARFEQVLEQILGARAFH